MTRNRLLDGQFDECDITIRDLDQVERAMVKTILSVYHGRIASPSTAASKPLPRPPAPTAPTA